VGVRSYIDGDQTGAMHNLQGQKMGDRYQDQWSRQRLYSGRSYPEVKKEEGSPYSFICDVSHTKNNNGEVYVKVPVRELMDVDLWASKIYGWTEEKAREFIQKTEEVEPEPKCPRWDGATEPSTAAQPGPSTKKEE
jgi:hypothetical protein